MNNAQIHKLHVHEKHTILERMCHVCEFCENDAHFPRVEFVDFLKITFFYENHSIPMKNVNFCEFCEKDARFQRGRINKYKFQ